MTTTSYAAAASLRRRHRSGESIATLAAVFCLDLSVVQAAIRARTIEGAVVVLAPFFPSQRRRMAPDVYREHVRDYNREYMRRRRSAVAARQGDPTP